MSEHNRHEDHVREQRHEEGENRPHPETHLGYEPTDTNVKGAVGLLSGIFGGLLVTLAIAYFIQAGMTKSYDPGKPNSRLAPGRVVPTGPVLEVHPWDTLPELRKQESKRLNEYGRDANGDIHIPVDQAMNLMLKQLPVRANSPVGITTPGGEGRTFSGSTSDMPPSYQRPQIQGEIEKNAQK